MAQIHHDEVELADLWAAWKAATDAAWAAHQATLAATAAGPEALRQAEWALRLAELHAANAREALRLFYRALFTPG